MASNKLGRRERKELSPQQIKLIRLVRKERPTSRLLLKRNGTDVLKALANMMVETPQSTSGLQVFRLKWPSPIGVDYLTLDVAVWTRVLDVAEMDLPVAQIFQRGQLFPWFSANDDVSAGSCPLQGPRHAWI